MENLRRKPIVFIGQFGPPSLACIRSWGRLDLKVAGIFFVSRKNGIKPVSRYLVDSICIPKKQLFTDKGFKAIRKFLFAINAGAISCVNERVGLWLLENRNNLPSGVEIYFPSKMATENLLCKKYQLELAEKVGFNLLCTKLVSQKDNANTLKFEYPVCLRPTVPEFFRPAFKVKVVKSQLELMDFLNSLERFDRPIIAQPFVSFPNLVLHGSRTVSGKIMGISCFAVNRKFEGVSLTVEPCETNSETKRKVVDFVEKADLIGNFHFEFLKDMKTGTEFFLEINARFGGTTAKVLRCGYDEPGYMMQAYGQKIEPRKRIENIVASNRQALAKYIVWILKKRLSPLDFPEEAGRKRLRWALKALFTIKDENWAWDDCKGTAMLFIFNLTQRN